MSVDHEGLLIVGGAIGAKLSGVLWRLFSSGKIRATDADRLWAEAGKIRTSLGEEIGRLEAKLDAALNENNALVQSNRTLAAANSALLLTVDDLQQTNLALVDANKRLEQRVEELLAHLRKRGGLTASKTTEREPS